jgi:hypothetical protein
MTTLNIDMCVDIVIRHARNQASITSEDMKVYAKLLNACQIEATSIEEPITTPPGEVLPPTTVITTSEIFVSPKKQKAKARKVGNDFTLMRGSEISKRIDSPGYKFYQSQIDTLRRTKALANHPTNPGKYLLIMDAKLSPSAAASLVVGGSVSGYSFWKNEKTRVALNV